MIREKLQVISPLEAYNLYGSEKSVIYLLEMFEQLSDDQAAQYLAKHNFGGDINQGWRDLKLRRYKAPFANVNS